MDEVLGGLAALLALDSLCASGCCASGPGLARLAAGCPVLAQLDLHGCKRVLRPDALAAIGAMARLRVLNLSACGGCTDAAVAALPRPTALRELNLAATAVTKAGLAELEAALPDLAQLSAWGCRATRPRPGSGGLRFARTWPRCPRRRSPRAAGPRGLAE